MFKIILKAIAFVYVIFSNAAFAAPIEQIELQRTVCFGTCPAYTVTIKSDGSVSFDGRYHVQRKGKATSTITGTDWEFLVAAVQKINFFSLKDSYSNKIDGCTSVWTDSPSLEIKVTRGSEQKRVSYYQGCRGPKELAVIVWLGNTIDFVANTQQWIGSE